ncbi:SpoIIE family protein phosphatase [Streptomyces sp. NPDC003857]
MFTTEDQLLLYTDGVTETRGHTGAFFPLVQYAGLWDVDSPSRLLEQLHRDLVDYSRGRLDDDIAAIAIRASATTARNGAGGRPRRPLSLHPSVDQLTGQALPLGRGSEQPSHHLDDLFQGVMPALTRQTGV